MLEFEFALPPNGLAINATCQIIEQASTAGFPAVPNTTPAPTNRFIQTDQDWLIRFEWTETGLFVPFLGGGDWLCEVYFEEMGSGETNFNPSEVVPDPGIPCNPLSVDVQVNTDDLDPGLYRVICSMQWRFNNGTNGPIVLFGDHGIIKIYQES